MELVALVVLFVAGAAICSACCGTFRYQKKNGSWRAYFKGKPSSMSHVLRDNDGYYVCWDRPLRSEREARVVAEQWTKRYG